MLGENLCLVIRPTTVAPLGVVFLLGGVCRCPLLTLLGHAVVTPWGHCHRPWSLSRCRSTLELFVVLVCALYLSLHLVSPNVVCVWAGGCFATIVRLLWWMLCRYHYIVSLFSDTYLVVIDLFSRECFIADVVSIS